MKFFLTLRKQKNYSFGSAIRAAILWCVFGIFVVVGLREANVISRFPKISLRYENGISGQAAFRSREISVGSDENFFPTFWRESRAKFSVGRGEIFCDVILFSGDANLVWHAEFVAGSAPGFADETGVAVSEALAHKIWGGTNIVGQKVDVDEKNRVVRGVFRDKNELALLSFDVNDASQNWAAAELADDGKNFGAAENFALVSGLGRPDYVLTGGVISFAQFVALAPLFIPFVYFSILILIFLRKYYSNRIAILFFSALILFAIFLPAMLDSLPDWLIPTRWSDFSFWSSLFRESENNLREFLSAPPTLRDVELKIKMLRLFAISFLSVCSGFVAVFYVHRKIFRK
ncbi:MAG: hypothetical protein FWD19_00960 [Defluviitaleaceae bacterium]|nr:hypothetical protein [Defluviitaleaceae bacterium]